MRGLSPLELSAAFAIAEQIGLDGGSALIDQLVSARITAREFTGFGFFTEFAVDQTLPVAIVSESPGGLIRIAVGPDQYPLEFVLYVKDGYAGMLEAYSHFDGYGDLDLLTCEFGPPVSLEKAARR